MSQKSNPFSSLLTFLSNGNNGRGQSAYEHFEGEQLPLGEIMDTIDEVVIIRNRNSIFSRRADNIYIPEQNGGVPEL